MSVQGVSLTSFSTHQPGRFGTAHVNVGHALAIVLVVNSSLQDPVSGSAGTCPSMVHSISQPLQGIPVPMLKLQEPHAVYLSGE